MLKQFLIDYSHDVINRDVVACKKHTWACMRFLRDVEREGTDAFPYVFDEDKGMRFFEWMHLFRHTKGVLKGEKITPHDIQYFVFGNIYGWMHRDTGYRRFKYMYWQVARKNAKSQSLSCVASYEAGAMGEDMAEVYTAGTKKEQSKIVWNETEVMLKRCPELKDRFKTKYGIIKHLKSDSIIKPLSKEDGKKGDGTNPQCGIVDEYHLHENTDMYDVIDSGMIARKQPLLIIITTAGKDLNSPCYRIEYDMVSNLLNPDNPIENDEYFAMVNELDKDDEGELIDDIKDELVWEKANPIVASYPEGVNSLRRRLKTALDAPEKMDDFITKNMNVWINAGAKKYMPMNKWATCSVVEDFPGLRGRECYVGLDLASKIDLASIGFEFVLDDGRIAVKSHSFMPENTVALRTKTDKIRYDIWVEKGWITATPGDVIDFKFIKKYMMDTTLAEGWIIKEICFDPYQATQFATDMADEGFVTVEIRQGFPTLSEPTKNFREKTYAKEIIHDKNPVLGWAIGNAITRTDHNGNIMLDKQKSTNKIDPIAAIINAHVRAHINEAPKKSIYETKGVRQL